MKADIIYDAVTCVGKQHVVLAIKTINSLLLFSEARIIYVAAPLPVLKIIRKEFGNNGRICLIPEEDVLEGVDIKGIKERFTKRAGNDYRFGWYLQQFIKMGVSQSPELSDHYLIWDSDTVLLRKMTFFDKSGKILISPSDENHKPYFRVMNKILGFGKQVEYSFVSQHLMVKKEYMRSLIKCLATHSGATRSWPEFILDSIETEHLSKSGFSEYETYGNFIAFKFSHTFLCREIKATRIGSMLCGRSPDRYAFFSLMRSGYTYAAFESWHSVSKRTQLINSAYSRILWTLHLLTRSCRRQLTAASELASSSRSWRDSDQN